MAPEPIRVFTDPSCELHVNEISGVERPERLGAATRGVEEAAESGVELEHPAFDPASRELLASVHDRRYLELLEAAEAAGGGYLDPDTSMNEHTLTVCRLAAGGAAAAAESALGGASAFAVVRPPGHHARSDRGMGFCYLNHAAIAASHALRTGAGRVAILDWDVHHGNGTQEIFYDTDRVLYLSAHRSPFYPGTGAAEEVGRGAGEGYTVNLPLPARSGRPEYASAFREVLLPVLGEYSPDLVILSAGYDAHARDPLGGMRLGEEDFSEFAAALQILATGRGGAPVAAVLEGGYDLEALSSGVRETIISLDRAAAPGLADWDGFNAPEPVRRAKSVHARYWPALCR